MIASSLNDFTEMVNMGMRLEEEVRGDVCPKMKHQQVRSMVGVSLKEGR